MRNICACLLLFLCWLISAANAEYLLPELAFQTNIIQLSNNKLDVHFKIAEGYAIYQDKVQITVTNGSSVKIGKIKLPMALKEHNDVVGDYYVYKSTADIIVPIIDKGDGKLVLNLTYQGCKGYDYCYPAISETKTVLLNNSVSSDNKILHNNSMIDSKQQIVSQNQGILGQIKGLSDTTNSYSVAEFFANSFWLVVLGFFCIGVLLALTPCVFPLLPVLFTLVVGQNSNFRKSVLLSNSYVLGMASAYAIAGAVFAVFGNNLQTIIQNNITDYILAGIFVLFSLSLLGLFDIRLPHRLQNKLTGQTKYSGNIIGTYLVGAISTIILSPCVTAPLAGALLYIASTGNVMLGAIALFAMGLGCGVPLLVITVFGNKILPKSGNWLLIIKDVLAFFMLAMSIYIGTRGTSFDAAIICFSVLLAISGTYLLLSKKYLHLKHRWVFTLFSVFLILLSGYIIGYERHINNFYNEQGYDKSNQISSIKIKDLAALEEELDIAKNLHKPAILSFTASWCLACKELEATTFKDKDVIARLKNFQMIEVDITSNDDHAKALMKRYDVMAPPTLIFIDKNGDEIKNKRILGFIASDKLLSILKTL